MPITAWTAELRDRLADVTVTGELSAALAGDVIDRVRRFGFAIVDSSAVAGSPAAIDRRSGELHELGTALGTPIVQSPRRELVEDVKDFSDIEDGDDRGYRSGGELLPHSDPPTINLLHCVRPARSGGESSLVSVAAILERLAAESPRLVEALREPAPVWRVAGQDGLAEAGPADDAIPILADRDGVTSCVLYRPFVELAADALGSPLSDAVVEALDRFERWSLADELTLRFTLRAGQTLAVHNRTVLHARTDYDDHPELDRRRHLLRMWIDAPAALPVHPDHELGDIFAVPARG